MSERSKGHSCTCRIQGTCELHGITGPPPSGAWVDLGALYRRAPHAPRHVVPDGLDLEGRVPGALRSWVRSVNGDWLGVVTFEIRYADGRRHNYLLSNQLVPAYALTKRT